MNDAAPETIAVTHVIDDVLRRDRGRLLAGLMTRLGDFQLAEDALQEACMSALKHWSRMGAPHDPLAWLMKVGLNKGIDHMRAGQRETRKSNDLRRVSPEYIDSELPETIPDERLRLIFTCCHPALEEKSRVALTLRTVCNLTTREIAAAFLDTEQTMGQRLSRAKAKIRLKGIAYRVPEPDQWQSRLETVLSTVYLIFTTGYVTEDDSARDLCREGIFLARLLNHLKPGEPEMEGVLALMLLTEARRSARIDADGVMVPVESQDPAHWQDEFIAEAQAVLEGAIRKRAPGPFQIKAAIADCHMMRPGPDWPQMSLLYQSLWAFEPTPVVALNWSVVMAETGRAELALEKLGELQSELEEYQPWHAARAHVLEKVGRIGEACAAYDQAIRIAPNAAARRLLERKRQVILS
ncbi:RNA polymerase sigma factor [Granulosicoccus sp. 3-233]|uniref:RNA polymerase sigma factor n=1 Tax=Granulosicoccus sp. 3-233 TaxID=3417969 RepID=UPI003D348DD4